LIGVNLQSISKIGKPPVNLYNLHPFFHGYRDHEDGNSYTEMYKDDPEALEQYQRGREMADGDAKSIINIHNTQQVQSYINDFIYVKQDDTCEEDRLHYLIHVLKEIAIFEGWDSIGGQLDEVFKSTTLGKAVFKEV
jgi:hypothetical protein